MRWPKIGLFLLTLPALLAIPLTAEALQVKFCVPDCATAGAAIFTTAGQGTRTTAGTGATRKTTTTVTLSNINVGGFSVVGTSGLVPRAIAEQSSNLQKISIAGTTIRAPASGCTTAAPCRLEVIMTSHFNDYPVAKPTGGYAAGAFMSGYFTGNQGASPNGDTISMTAEASGLTAAAGNPVANQAIINEAHALNRDVINATPGTSTGDTAVSLPWVCTGQTSCTFTANVDVLNFLTQGQQTVQQKCDTGVTTCRTRLRTKLNIKFKTPNNTVSLPTDVVHVPPDSTIPPSEVLITQLAPPFDSLNVQKLGVDPKKFGIKASFTLDDGGTIDPANEEVFLRIGDSFGLTIPPRKFKRLVLKGIVTYSFLGRVSGRDVGAAFIRGANPLAWTFWALVHGTGLDLPPPATEVSVDFGVGNDNGSDLVTTSTLPSIFP